MENLDSIVVVLAASLPLLQSLIHKVFKTHKVGKEMIAIVLATALAVAYTLYGDTVAFQEIITNIVAVYSVAHTVYNKLLKGAVLDYIER